MNPRERVMVAVLAATGLSAGGFLAWVDREGYSEQAIIPVAGDVPTIGNGSTHYENGQPVRMGDRITRVRAEQLARNLMSMDAKALAASMPGVVLFPAEWDEYLDYVGQYGIGRWRASTMRSELLAGNYAAACTALLLYRFQNKRDCSLPQNWGPRGCKGVWTRQQTRYTNCMEAQHG